jgi:TP901 family phage tail tape measure protein
MGQQFVIPSVFTAVDKLTSPIRGMTRTMRDFGRSAEASMARLDRKMRPIGRQAAIVGTSILAPLALAANEASKFETSLQSFRTIVSDLNDSEFSKYSDAIKTIGDKTKKTYTDVAESFEKIAGLNEKFADTAEGISAVTEAAITLSRASRQDLGQSAENLVGIMNQFSLGAMEANRVINVLASGQSAGAASIAQTAESFVNFGSVAAGANITLEQSVALIQTLGKFSLFGAEAGTKLRGAILRIQKAGVGYKSGQFQINDALLQARKHFDRLATAKQKDSYLNKLFGAENIAAGRILLSNIDTYEEFTKKVTGTSEAQKAAAINQNSLAEKVKNVKAQFQNFAVKIGEKLIPALSRLVDKVGPLIDSFITWTNNNPGTISSILKVSVAIAGLSYVIAGVAGVIAISTKAMAIFNAVASLNPAWVLVAGLAILTAGIYDQLKAQTKLTAAERVANQVRERALENSIDQRVEVTMLFAALRKATIGSEEFKNTLQKIEAIQPGITKQYNLQAGAINSINEAEKALTKSIIERAMAEARGELIREKTKELLQEQAKTPGWKDYMTSGLSHGRMSAEMVKAGREAGLQGEINALAGQISIDKSNATFEPNTENKGVLPSGNQAREDRFFSKLEKILSGGLNVDVSGGANVKSSTPFLNVKTSPTFGY